MIDKFIIDKSEWGEGPWQHEPDYKEFMYKGFYCLLRRHHRYGNWTGYVAIDPQSKLAKEDCRSMDLDVHGGITYEAFRNPLLSINIPEDDSLFWIGFDCHSGRFKPDKKGNSVEDYEDDYAPGEQVIFKKAGYSDDGKKEFYRTIEFAINELESLIDQIINLDKE